MTETYTYDGGTLATVRGGSVEFTQSAEHGSVGSGRFIFEDNAGTQSMVGQKDVSHTEDACATHLTFRGYVDDRVYQRGAAFPLVSASRDIEIAVVDLNAILSFRLIDGTDGNRPAETVGARLTWLLASNYLSGLVIDNGRVTYPTTKGMDAADYRTQSPGDVLADCEVAADGFNHHVQDYGSGPELIFRNDNTSTADTCTLKLSNVLTDTNSTTLAPNKDFTLTRKPAGVYSKIGFQWAKDTTWGSRAATASAFNGERDGTASNSNIKTSSKAADEVTSLLWQHHTEEDILEGTVLVKPSQVNLLPPGWRIQAKFSHLNTEGYGSYTYFRILERSVRPQVTVDGLYEVHLKLSPQEPAAPAAKILQSVFGRTTEGGGYLTFGNPVTVGSILVFAISDRGVTNPGSPNISGSLPNWGTGAWTRFNGATISASNGDGAAMYYKTADSANQQTYIGGTNCVVGAWELSGGSPASATVVYVNSGTGTSSYSLGTLSSVLTTEVAMALWIFGDGDWPWGGPGAAPSGGYAWDQAYPPGPAPMLAAGWTQRISAWAYDSYVSTYYKNEHPWATIADATGTGASLAATITPGLSSKNFAGIAIRIPA